MYKKAETQSRRCFLGSVEILIKSGFNFLISKRITPKGSGFAIHWALILHHRALE